MSHSCRMLLLLLCCCGLCNIVLCQNCVVQLQKDRYPNIGLSTTDLILKYGYPVQKYVVETEDGYLLDLVRIPHSKNDFSSVKRPVVLFQHGIQASTDDLLVTGSEYGLPYLLSDRGYDVWLGNNRGNKYSMKHVSLSHEDKRFWNFSFHEMGIYDLPAMIDKALNVSATDSLIYIGHSQGSTIGFVLLSQRPEYNPKIRLMLALAPAAFLSNTKCLLCKILSRYPPILQVFSNLGMDNIRPNPLLMSLFGQIFCTGGKYEANICREMLFTMFGRDPDQLNNTLIPVITSIMPAGSSIKQFVHFLQIIKSGRFEMYNYNSKTNRMIYGKKTPPSYNLFAITSPVALYFGLNDNIISQKDVDQLKINLRDVVEYRDIKYDKFSHMDFLFAEDVRSLVYDYAVNLCDKYR